MVSLQDNGINLFDNAEAYAAGNSEIEMGNAFKELKLKREEIVVTTKIFFGTKREDPNQKGRLVRGAIRRESDDSERRSEPKAHYRRPQSLPQANAA